MCGPQGRASAPSGPEPTAGSVVGGGAGPGGEPARRHLANPQGQRAEESPRRWRQPLPQETPKPQPKWGPPVDMGTLSPSGAFRLISRRTHPATRNRGLPEHRGLVLHPSAPAAQLPEPPFLPIGPPGTLEFLTASRGNLCCKDGSSLTPPIVPLPLPPPDPQAPAVWLAASGDGPCRRPGCEPPCPVPHPCRPVLRL